MNNDIETDVATLTRWIISLVSMFVVLMGLVWLLGCTGIRQTAKEPLHAESGVGITVGKIPIIGLGEWGSGNYGRVPSVIVHKYDYTAKPQPTPPGTPPAIDYPTIYGSAWDDPSLVIFKNESYRRVKIQIDRRKLIVLEPYSATADISLGLGEHRARVTVEKPTAAHGVWEEIDIFSIYVSPEGRSQIFHIYDW